MLEILYQDKHYIAIKKPAGMLVHRTQLASQVKEGFALQLLRDQLGQRVHPMHRIDRPTSGVLLFALSSEAAAAMREKFDQKEMEKYYLCLVRGYMKAPHATIDHPLKKNDTEQEAQTSYWVLDEVEIPFSSTPKHETSRYSLIKAFPHTGRMHQIRRHMAHERNYIIGDSTHGETRQNRFFRIQFQSHELLLHAWEMHFTHPFSGENISIHAPLPAYFQKMIHTFGWKTPAPTVKPIIHD